MKHLYTLLWGMALCCWSNQLIAQCTPPYLFPTLTATNVTCNGANDGCLTVNPVGARGNVGYQWSTGATTGPTLCGLGQGFYTVTITDTLSNGSAGVDTAYFQGFEGTHGWNLAVSTGASGATPNVWVVGDAEGGVLPPGCGTTNNGDSTLHITCTSALCGSVIRGAVYNATQTSNVRAESPAFSTVGLTNLTLTFDYISNGDGLLDNASLWYNAGAGWVVLDSSLKSTVCPTGQGRWTAYSVTLPTVCENNPSVQLAINWTNNSDNTGTDPSVAINNILVSTPRASGQVCTVVVSDSVHQPFVLVTSLDSIGPVVCTGSANGLIDLSVSGGTGPYTYLWSNGATTQDLGGLIDTTYVITVTDANNCTVVDTAEVPLVGALALVLDNLQAVACFGDSTGAIDITVNGDTSGLSCSSPIVALNEIMYRPTLRNGQNPNTGEYIELIGPPGTNIGCYVLTDGDWTITIPPGTTIPSDGYFTIGNNVVWGAGSFDLDAENCNCFTAGVGGQGLLILTDGGEYVALFDATGTFLQGLLYGTPSAGNTPSGQTINTVGTTGCVPSVTIPNAPAFETAIGGLAANTSLIRDPDGSGSWGAQVGGSMDACNAPNSTGGGSNITYLWSTGDTTQDLSGLLAGTYRVIATNRFGCTDTATYVVTQPNSPINVMVSSIDTICAGVTTGSIDLTVSGGTAPYTFIWSNGAITEDLTNLPAGSYCGTITDANGCTFNLCDTIVADSLDIPVDTLHICVGDSVQLPLNTTLSNIVWSPSVGLNSAVTQQPWAAPVVTTTYKVQAANGRAGTNLVVNGDFSQGNVGFTNDYRFYAGGQQDGYIIDTNAFVHNVRHTGVDHTTGTGNFLIADPQVGDVNVWCQTVNVTPSTVYEFSMWVSNIVSPNLDFGDPTLEVLINGNVVLNTGSIPENPDVWVNFGTLWGAGTDTTATICIRSVNSLVMGYDFGLDDISFAAINGCTLMDSVVVIVDSIDLSNTTVTSIACHNDSTGSISTNTTGLTYQWSTGATTSALNNLPAGTYSVTVTGTGGCVDSLSIVLTQPDSLYIQLDSILDISCFNGDPGSVNITPNGGVGPYTYAWSNGATSQDIGGLVAGDYCLTLTDANGCIDSLCATVVGRDTITIIPDTIGLCLGDSVVLNALLSSGTNRPIEWLPTIGLSSTSTLSTVARPTITTTYVAQLIFNGRSCPSSDSVVVLVDNAAISLTTTTTPLCYGDSTGDITVGTTSSNLQYLWNTGDTTANLTNVGAGTYTLVATGALGVCTDTLMVTLNQPDSLLLSVGAPTAVTCRNGSNGSIGVSTVTGGTPGYTYLWSNASTAMSLSNLTAGTYTLTVTDTNSCTVVGSVVVTQPSDSISITSNATPVSCDSTSNGTVTAIPMNGNPVYTYQWGAGTGNQTGATATNLPTGTYTVTVTDALGCTATAIGLFVPQSVGIDSSSLTLVTTDSLLDCDLLPTGAAQVNTTNTYTYLWSNGNTAQTVNDLPGGGYSVTVSNNGCSVVLFGNIDVPFIPVVDPFIDRTGVTSFTTTGGTSVNLGAGNDERPRVQYNWTSSPTINIDDPTVPLTTGNAQEPMTYAILLTATANNGCQDTGTVYLTIESEFLGMPDAFTPNGDNINDLYRPIGLTASNIVRFRVFNRWGQEVYNGDDLLNSGWDGRFQGVEQPTEVYIYLLEYQISTNSRVEMRKGEFTLIR